MEVQRKIDTIRLESFLPYQITVLAHFIARRTTAIAEAHGGLKLSQWRVMAAVAEHPGRTANQVAAVTPMDKGIVSRAVKRLLDMGLLRRRASHRDGRLAHLFLTRKGRTLYAELSDDIRKIEESLLDGFSSEEKSRLLELVTRAYQRSCTPE